MSRLIQETINSAKVSRGALSDGLMTFSKATKEECAMNGDNVDLIEGWTEAIVMQISHLIYYLESLNREE